MLPLQPDPQQDQYFLSNPEKISQLLRAADIQSCDRVLELGAGIGSVAKHIPPCQQLTLLELDPRLSLYLSQHYPQATIIQGDALAYLSKLSFDVLLSNLPWFLSHALLQQLQLKTFRLAIVALAETEQLSDWQHHFLIREITLLKSNDFTPNQPFNSRLIQLMPRQTLTKN